MISDTITIEREYLEQLIVERNMHAEECTDLRQEIAAIRAENGTLKDMSVPWNARAGLHRDWTTLEFEIRVKFSDDLLQIRRTSANEIVLRAVNEELKKHWEIAHITKSNMSAK
jgi:hypothetical protein